MKMSSKYSKSLPQIRLKFLGRKEKEILHSCNQWQQLRNLQQTIRIWKSLCPFLAF